jgi:hypothetical protein
MRIAVPHNTSNEIARRKVDQRLGQLLSQFGGHAEDIQHEWFGDTMRFRGKARGLAIEGTVEVTDAAVIIDAIDEQLPVDLDGRIVARVMRVRLAILVDAHELVLDAELLEEPLDQTGFMPLRAGEEPYGHRLPSLPNDGHRLMDLQTLGPFCRDVKSNNHHATTASRYWIS